MLTVRRPHLKSAVPPGRWGFVSRPDAGGATMRRVLWRLLQMGVLLPVLVGLAIVAWPSRGLAVTLPSSLTPAQAFGVGAGVTSALVAAWLGWGRLRAHRAARPGQGRRKIPRFGPRRRADSDTTLTSWTSPQEVSRRLVEVQETVRREMADYLHGHVQSKLVALSISLGSCQKALRRDPGMAYRMLDRIQEELKRIQDEDLRRVSTELYPAIIKIGLAPALQSLVDRFKDLIDIDLNVGPEVEALDHAESGELTEKLRLGIYRVAEEALTNVLKHAQASQARITLAREGADSLLLSVADNGRGFDTTQVSASQGLLAVADYAQAIGGRAQINSTPGQGTTVGVSLTVSWPQRLEAVSPVPIALPPAA